VNRYEYKTRKLEQQERGARLALEHVTSPSFRLQQKLAFLALAAIPAGLGGALCLGSASEATRTKTTGHLFFKKTTTSDVATSTRVGWLLAGIVLILIAGALATAGVRLATRQAGLRKYPPILAGREIIKIQQIAEITGHSVRRVCEDVQSLIGSGMIEDFYVDYQQEQVVSTKYIPKTSHKTVVTCSGCGANNDVIVGITKNCTFCMKPLVLASK
jgi:hypothetical protein